MLTISELVFFKNTFLSFRDANRSLDIFDERSHPLTVSVSFIEVIFFSHTAVFISR